MLLVFSSTNFAQCRYITKKCKTYFCLFDASLLCMNSVSADGPNNSISQSFRAAVNLCAAYAPYTQETESGLQNLCYRAGILSIPFHGLYSQSLHRKAVVDWTVLQPACLHIKHLAYGECVDHCIFYGMV